MQKIVLISIKPKFANQILFGVKKFEYRKTSIDKATTHMVLYMTAPIQRIVGMVSVKQVLSGAPSTIWEKTKSEAGIVRKFYRTYFKDAKTAYAIELDEVTPFNHWINPKDILSNFRPPQSFKYIDNDFFTEILKHTDQTISKRNNLIFFAGIHGVGKSTFCDKLKKNIGIDSFSASQLIKAAKGDVSITKEVKDFNNNQFLLLEQLKKLSSRELFILDGHFCLINSDKTIEKIPKEIFKQINPIEIILLEINAKEITRRLLIRDNIKYDVNMIEHMLSMEREHAIYISDELHIPIRVITDDEYPTVQNYITSLANK